MTPEQRHTLAANLMEAFAAETGLLGAARVERYLWTDAFAVCNFLGLHSLTQERRYLELAMRLVDKVHHVLGRHREDDTRRGWLSGLAGADAEAHPTRGGLRIGKPDPERGVNEPYDTAAEWNRDGQYLHYLTQWMHALHRLSEDTGTPHYDAWAVELAEVAHAAFARAGRRANLAGYPWKMSIDLQRALVPASGQHDAIDAFVSYLELGAGSRLLSREAEEARRMTDVADLATDDALGIGSLLLDACRLARLGSRATDADGDMLLRMLSAAAPGLEAFASRRELEAHASTRLAFRELGLSIGLHALERMDRAGFGRSCQSVLAELLGFTSLAHRIDAFWILPAHRSVASWVSHRGINGVMLATSLLPSGYLRD